MERSGYTADRYAPGIGDAILDVIRLFGRMEFLTVTTPSRLTRELTKKELRILHELGIKIVGVLENMRIKGTGPGPADESGTYDVPFLGAVDLDSQLEGAMGDAAALLKTGFARQLNEVANRIGVGIS
jgi:Mrp family chromosome partitioning ATPase